jgi:uncharacterized protein YjbJ (UPF0337 family)
MRQAAEEAGTLVDRSKQQTNGHVDRTRQAAEEVGAIVDQSKQQTNGYVDRRRAEGDRRRGTWEEFVASNYPLRGSLFSRLT